MLTLSGGLVNPGISLHSWLGGQTGRGYNSAERSSRPPEAGALTTYDHKQFMSWCVPIALAAPVVFCGAAMAPLALEVIVAVVVIVLVDAATLVGRYLYLYVKDTGDGLSVRYGPMPSRHACIPYASIELVERTRAGPLLIRVPGVFLPARLGRSDAVRVHLRAPQGGRRKIKTFIIGTDEPEKLVAFLREKIRAEPGGPLANQQEHSDS